MNFCFALFPSLPHSSSLFSFSPCFVYATAFDAAYELLATANGSVGGFYFSPEDIKSFLPKLG